MERGIRIDKWLWAVRLYKTRTLAAEACRAGKVKFLGQTVKPSHEVKTGEIFTIWMAPVTRTVKVTEILGHRLAAKLVAGFMEDLTPESEYEKLRKSQDLDFEFRQRGTGRPTKRERREIEFLKLYLDE